MTNAPPGDVLAADFFLDTKTRAAAQARKI
jgi:hypothetical protein